MSWVYHDTNAYGSMTMSEMQQNALEIYSQLYANYGWTVNAISAVLGNLQRESYLNPAQTQGGYPIGSLSGGYGLAMWTPAKKIKNWLQINNHSLYSGYWQIYALNDENWPHNYDPNYSVQYTPTTAFPETYEEFKHSGRDLAYLTEAFLKNYEKAGVQALAERIANANYWYSYLTGQAPPTPTPPDPDPTGYKRTSKVWLFMRNKNKKF